MDSEPCCDGTNMSQETEEKVDKNFRICNLTSGCNTNNNNLSQPNNNKESDKIWDGISRKRKHCESDLQSESKTIDDSHISYKIIEDNSDTCEKSDQECHETLGNSLTGDPVRKKSPLSNKDFKVGFDVIKNSTAAYKISDNKCEKLSVENVEYKDLLVRKKSITQVNDDTTLKESQYASHHEPTTSESVVTSIPHDFMQRQYIASDQAIVTNVEMVMPLPNDLSYGNCSYNPNLSLADQKVDSSRVNTTITQLTQNSIPLQANPSSVDSSRNIDTTHRTINEGIWTPHTDYHEQHITNLGEDQQSSGCRNQNGKNEHNENSVQAATEPEGLQSTSKNYPSVLQLGSDNYENSSLIADQKAIQNPYNQALNMQHQQNYVHHQSLQHQHHQTDLYSQMLQQENMSTNIHFGNFPQQPYRHEPLYGLHHHLHDTRHTHSPFHYRHQLQRQTHIQQQQQSHPVQEQMQEVFNDLLIDEFHEDPNSATYKLGLSPNHIKPENQDDGYETSAGDVLTPNSHSSSTHSGTPQHQIQHGVLNLMAQSKPEDHQQPQQAITSVSSKHHQTAHQQGVGVGGLQINNNISSSNTSQTRLGSSSDPYSFIEEEISPASGNLQNVSNSNNFDLEISDTRQNHNESFILNQHEQQLQKNIPQQEAGSTTSKPEGKLSLTTNEKINVGTDFIVKTTPKRRGRKKKIVPVDGLVETSASVNYSSVISTNAIINMHTDVSNNFLKTKERKKHDRFNGMPEDEVIKRTIPDHLCNNLDIIIVGINPGLFAAYKGHHYAGPGNHFWKCLYLSGLTQEQMSADEDYKLMKQGIGFTNMVARATKGSADLTRKEIKEGSRVLLEKLQIYKPKIAVFNGKLIFEVFSGKKDFNFGKQPECVEGTETYIWVMPSSSARCAQLPRAADKVPFYSALKKFREYLNGQIQHVDDSEFIFTEQRIKQCCDKTLSGGELDIEHRTDQLYEGIADPHSNTVSIANHDAKILSNFSGNLVDGSGSYIFNGDGIAGHAHGPGPPLTDNYIHSFCPESAPSMQEKKKRGRPKKNKNQDIVDPSTGKKIIINNNQQQRTQHDFNNILNLSIIGGESAKKKRGRPKKLKVLPLEIIPQSKQSSTTQQSQHLLQQQTTLSPQLQHNLYNTPPPSHMRYNASVSPMASPALNCSYPRNTPPIHAQDTPPITEQHTNHDAKTKTDNLRDNPTEHLSNTQNKNSHIVGARSQTNLGETPPPNSPNICAVNFEPPALITNIDHNQHHQKHQQLQITSYALSPHPQSEITSETREHENYNEWISSQQQPQNELTHQKQQQHQQHSQSPVPQPHFSNNRRYQELSALQQDQNQSQWQSDNLEIPYLVASPIQSTSTNSQQQQQLRQPDTSLQNSLTDVARKSLSGLESLVEQIPTIREQESSAIAPVTATALESRLLGLQQHQHQHCPLSHSLTPTEVSQSNDAAYTPTSTPANSGLNNSFSVSNLAASSASNQNSNSHHISHHYNNTEFGQPSTNATAYQHHQQLISAALAAAAVSSATPVAHHVPHHPQMYMDPHMTHMSHVPVNAMYGPATTHHHHATYGSAGPQHSTGPTSDYNPYGLTSSTSQTAALHMPSPNYPYGHYGHTSPQGNYPGFTPHSHGHTPHPLSMFERLKPSDIGGYSGF